MDVRALDLKTKALLVGGALIVAYVLIRLASSGIKRAAAAVGTAVNPMSDQNLAYLSVNAATQAVTGDPYATFGTKLFEVLHPGTLARERTATTGDPAPQSVYDLQGPVLP